MEAPGPAQHGAVAREERQMSVKRKIIEFFHEEEGLTTVEYAIAGGLVGAAVIAAFIALGAKVGDVIEYITGKLQTPG
jgi:pilus assembly protein Flp/PilA